MSERRTQPSDRSETQSEREQRLAEALRANLRRRKKPQKKSPSDQTPP